MAELIALLITFAFVLFIAHTLNKFIDDKTTLTVAQKPCPPHQWRYITEIDQYNTTVYKTVCDKCKFRAGSE